MSRTTLARRPDSPRRAVSELRRSAGSKSRSRDTPVSPAGFPAWSAACFDGSMVGKRILVIDSDPDMLEVAVESLERLEGVSVVGEVDPRAGSTLLAAERFDLLLTGLRMPGMDGLKLLAQARAQSHSPQVLVLTAYPTRDSAQHCRALGGIYLCKPITPTELANAARRVLERPALATTQPQNPRTPPMKSLDTILIAMDANDAAAAAWKQAAMLASTFGGELVPVHAVPDAGSSHEFFDSLAQAFQEQITLLSDQARRDGLSVRRSILRTGDPVRVLQGLIEEVKPDLVVLGGGEKSTLDRILLGSTAERALRELGVPVLLVHPDHEPGIKKILCAVDGSEPARAALEAALFLARSTTASIELLTIHDPKRGAPGEPSHGLDLHGIDVTQRTRSGKVEEILVDEASQGFDLLVMGEAGRRGFARLRKPNAAEKVLRRLPCSLLAIKG